MNTDLICENQLNPPHPRSHFYTFPAKSSKNVHSRAVSFSLAKRPEAPP